MVLIGNHYLGAAQLESLRPRVTFTLCSLWQLRRRDGVTLYFASHDKPVVFQGQTFVPLGPNASNLETKEALGESDMDIVGCLSADAIKPSDLHAGRYDGASITHWYVDWERPWPWLWVRKHVWYIKTLAHVGGIWRAQVFGIERWLTIPGGRRFEIECDLTLGEPRCGATPVTVFGATVSAVAAVGAPIAGATDPRLAFTISSGTWATPPRDGLMVLGEATATSGPNKGKRILIAYHSGRTLVVEEPFPFGVKVGDTFALKSGCDHTLTTCTNDYGRRNNYGGIPFMPTAQDQFVKPVET